MTEHIKNYLGIAGIVALAAISVGVLWGVHAYDEASEPNNYRSFSVSAESEQVVIPDVATFSFQIITEGNTSDLGGLQLQNSEQSDAIISYVKEQDVADEDIKTTQYRINPRYQYYDCSPRPITSSGGTTSSLLAPESCPPPEIVGYTVTQGIEVKVRDFEKLGSLVSGVVDQGANQVSGVTFSVDKPEEVRDQIRAEAIQKARDKAEAIADAGGFDVGKLISLNESGSQPPIIYGRGAAGYDAAVSESAGANAASLEPGSQDITVSVTLQYEIDD